MKEEVFYKHVRETTFTKDYTLCGKVVEVKDDYAGEESTYELHIGAYVFPVDELFIKKNGTTNALLEAQADPLVVIKLTDGHSLHTFLDFSKVFLPRKAVKKKVLLNQVIT